MDRDELKSFLILLLMVILACCAASVRFGYSWGHGDAKAEATDAK